MTTKRILIVGGGLVGASLALALSRQPQNHVVLLESRPFQFDSGSAAWDERTVALAYGSRLIYEQWGVWPAIAPEAEPIAHIHVSDKGFLGASRLHAREEQVPALGYVVPNRRLSAALARALRAADNVELLAPATLDSFEQHADKVRWHAVGESAARESDLLIAADGIFSPIRQQLGLKTQEEDYAQTAIIANVGLSKPHEGWAFERFTRNGPIALLPLPNQAMSLVWSVAPDQVDTLQALSAAEFLQGLQQYFGYRAGRFTTVGQRQAFPLRLMRVEQECRQRVLIFGNAAHSIHPVAGQGLNLSLRDARVLAEVIQAQDDPGAEACLQRYRQSHARDVSTIIRATDGLVRVFSRDWALLGHARALGLMAVDSCPSLRHQLARFSMGIGR